MDPKKTFLILTSDCGFGHRSTANAIDQAMQELHPEDSKTVIVNPLTEESSAPFLKQSEQNYDKLVTTNPKFYRFSYELGNSRVGTGLAEGGLTLVLFRDLQKLIQEINPNAILNTKENLSGPTGTALDLMNERRPLYTVVTDLADVNVMWFNNYPDRYFVASDAVRSKAIDYNIDPKKITISGIPVNPGFTVNHAAKPELRTKLGLDPQLPTLLFIGSSRVKGIFEHLEALEIVTLPFQVAVIAGGNNELYEKVRQRHWNFPIQIQNYVTNMPEWMFSADILVTKAGGLVLSEGLAVGLPILMIDFLPGQEEGNVKFIQDNHAGMLVKNPDDFPGMVTELLRDDQGTLEELSSNSRRCGHPDAALVIADALWQADEVLAPRTAPPPNLWNRVENDAD